MGGELKSCYCISIGSGKAVGKLRIIPGILGEIISLLIVEDDYVGLYLLQSAGSLGCNYSVFDENYILALLRAASQDRLDLLI
ncbi:hypothetical protein TNCV_5038371 [Trichonephila clavipes]|nr:hypothetical protein TNCV_5038371 [Trichonephila clavipes]